MTKKKADWSKRIFKMTKKKADWSKRFDEEFNRKTTLAVVSGEFYDIGWLKKEIKHFISQELKREREKTGKDLRKKMRLDYHTVRGSGGNVRELIISEDDFNNYLKEGEK